MAWISAAVAVVGAVMSNVGANKDRHAAEAARKDEMAFEQQRYDDWQAVYGSVQDNLSNYYSNLTPEYIETQGLEAVEIERAKALGRLDVDMAQRGITDSGIAGKQLKDIELGTAEQRATVRATAPSLVAEEQSRFLQIGLGQNPDESMSRMLANQAITKENRAGQSSRAAGDAIGSALTEVGTALADYNKGGSQ